MVLGPQNSLLAFAAYFDTRCGWDSLTRMTGSLQYQSNADVPTTIVVSPTALSFGALLNGGSAGPHSQSQTVGVSISRPGVGWSATTDQPWIHLSSPTGTGSGHLAIGLNLAGRRPATATEIGKVTITPNDGSPLLRTVDIKVIYRPSGTTALPIGTIDTPLSNASGVAGAIPVTGWALDDIGVTGVSICRAAVSGEAAPIDGHCGGANEIFIGQAVFIEGARPDVEAAYPAYPRSNIAGWGFMLLTNTLPSQGNGTFAISAYAHDHEGRAVRLGTRTITCDNANATAPFGTIDTPFQGETIAGPSYVNFGWALTPNPKSIATDGSTLMVYVDGVPVGQPSYGHFRSDIAAAFPGYANSNGAVGFRILDTTTLADGLHTIVWTATDSAGVTSGLGSRFFRVANGSAASVTTVVRGAMSHMSSTSNAAVAPGEAVTATPLDMTPLIWRRGWEPGAQWWQSAVEPENRIVLRGEELDRFELLLGTRDRSTHRGWLRVDGQLRGLPAGSHLDPQTGVFRWSPGVGFVGTYDLVFVRTVDGQTSARREVRIVLEPKGQPISSISFPEGQQWGPTSRPVEPE